MDTLIIRAVTKLATCLERRKLQDYSPLGFAEKEQSDLKGPPVPALPGKAPCHRSTEWLSWELWTFSNGHSWCNKPQGPFERRWQQGAPRLIMHKVGAGAFPQSGTGGGCPGDISHLGRAQSQRPSPAAAQFAHHILTLCFSGLHTV